MEGEFHGKVANSPHPACLSTKISFSFLVNSSATLKTRNGWMWLCYPQSLLFLVEIKVHHSHRRFSLCTRFLSRSWCGRGSGCFSSLTLSVCGAVFSLASCSPQGALLLSSCRELKRKPWWRIAVRAKITSLKPWSTICCQQSSAC